MLDELTEKAIDRIAVKGARWFAPYKVRIKNSAIGFRLSLIATTVKQSFFGLFAQISTEDRVEEMMQRAFEGRGETQKADRKAVKAAARARLRKGLAGMDRTMVGIRLGFLLLMTMLCACLVAARGLRELAVLSAFFCLCFLSVGMEEDYEPVCSGVRQRYLAAQLLRAGAYLALLLDYFVSYAQNGLPSNVALQGAMAITMIVHGGCYLSLVALNKRQPIFLRALAGVLGLAPALAAAAGAALAAANIAQEWPLAIGGLLRALGVGLAFFSEEYDMTTQLGGIQLRYARLWRGLMETIGFFLMLTGAWVSAL